MPRNRTPRIKLSEIIDSGMVKTPLYITTKYKGKSFEGIISTNGKIKFDDREFPSPSSAAVAVKELVLGEQQVEPVFAQASGWDFWHYRNNKTGAVKPLRCLRDEYKSLRGSK